MSQVFDPYSSWLGIPPEQHPPDHYTLLGLQLFEQDPQVIREAAERRAVLVHSHRTGEQVEISERILHDLAAAADCLLNPQKRTEYDDRLREARRMEDTRTMSDPDLDVGSAVTATKSKRWEAADRERSAVELRPEPKTPSPPASGSDAESEGSLASGGSSSGALDSATDVVSAPPDRRRHPLLTVVLVSSALGVLLVAMLAVVAALTGSRSLQPAPDDPVSVRPTSTPNRATATDTPDPADPPNTLSPAAVSAVTPSEEPPDRQSDPAPPADASSPADEPDPLPPTPPKPAPPSAAEQEPLLARLEAAHDFNQLVTRRQMLDLAEQLLDQAAAGKQPSGWQYVLLLKSAELATQADDPALAYAAWEQVCALFEVDRPEADRLLQETMGSQVDAGRELWQHLAQALETLVVDPLHPSSNLEVGSYYCFVRDDWERGLPYLAKGDDTALRLLAEKELSEPVTWRACLELGDTWWAVSLLAGPERKAVEQERAARWYRLAFPELEGADKRRAQSRLASLIAIPGAESPAGPMEAVPEDEPAQPADRDGSARAPQPQQPIDLTGMWKSDRQDSVYRLRDKGTTVRCELVSSKKVKQIDGLWLRDRGQLLSDRWRFSFVEDPVSRTWELGCEPAVVDERTIRLRAEVVTWDRYGRETERRWDTTHWRKLESLP